MSYLRYFCLIANSGVQHILCCVFVLFVLVLYTLCCQIFVLPIRYSLTFICPSANCTYNPHAIKLDLIMEGFCVCIPVVSCIWVCKIWKYCVPRPYLLDRKR